MFSLRNFLKRVLKFVFSSTVSFFDPLKVNLLRISTLLEVSIVLMIRWLLLQFYFVGSLVSLYCGFCISDWGTEVVKLVAKLSSLDC